MKIIVFVIFFFILYLVAYRKRTKSSEIVISGDTFNVYYSTLIDNVFFIDQKPFMYCMTENGLYHYNEPGKEWVFSFLNLEPEKFYTKKINVKIVDIYSLPDKYVQGPIKKIKKNHKKAWNFK
jgi:hypothetical protein